ncbi:hypothetical protein BT93_E0024 [Corymbia citriodora subsp. variegata]|nr:hypothetical protein BT93_E0024 [Corymbia citriodora subsp. variegata]
MEQRLLLQPLTPLPFSLLERPRLPAKPRTSCSPYYPEKTPFLGKTLILRENRANPGHPVRTSYPVRAGVKRRKELPFDNVIQRDKKLKLVLKMRKILVSQPDRTMSLRELGRYKRALGKFPAVFEIVEEGVYSLKFKLTPEAERLYLEELKVRSETEDLLVVKLRKLLMMSLEKRILLEKIAHLRTDLGLPLEFRDTICHQYPQYFRVIATSRGPALELTHWDPELAVSAAQLAEEENRAREIEEKNLIIDRPPKFNRVRLPKGLVLSRGEMKRIYKFRDMPYISPYSDFSALWSGTPEKEKHACGVVHEIFSLTVEKRTLVDHLTHFREEFRFSQQLRGMLIRHPDMFYVSLKGDRDLVFLREAYHGSHLVEKDCLLLMKEKLCSLVAVPQFPRRGVSKKDGDGADLIPERKDVSEEEGGKDWLDVGDLMNEGVDGDDSEDDNFDGDYDDDWTEEDEDTPPDFDEGGSAVNIGISKPIEQTGDSTKNEEELSAPTFPDGHPRERW